MSFGDFNIPLPAKQSTLDQLQTLGYASCAVNHIFSGKPANLQAPTIPVSKDARFKIYSRLTLVLEDTSQNYNLSKTAKGYDLLAVRPTSEKTLQYACTQMEVDIISIDLSQRLPYYLKHATLGSAISRGLFIEIAYAPSLTDMSSRRQLLSNASAIVRASRGRGLLITSGATQALGLRSPYDIINLATFWGLSQERGREALAENTRRVLKKAETRTSVYKGVLRIPETPEDVWPVDEEEEQQEVKSKQTKEERQSGKRAAEASQGATSTKKQKSV
ncbi:RNase P subunit p30-domain-containing protein [Protomyces lactucae-debilis]|uniref:RNase P subunit p30-domain-containing protein n=1 Tax=Protomyces lactucae-debilis TaxID=2754530 RepID=A0A1Y2F934_PROLT|nr:RNase P subunit p30-domain-containing protein [Protomyces lactucae-debilis]ORY80411.1 RNase P subunit p30-domain-containing protein [Protomyces lactucae-debilis]